MSRKFILSLAAAATVAVATLASQSADARGFGSGGLGGGGMTAGRGFGAGGMGMHTTGLHVSRPGITPIIPIRNPGHPIIPLPWPHPHPHWGWHGHGHWIFRDGGWVIVDDVVVSNPVVPVAPGPCTCLTKTYTPSGLVVFADVCTKESASAPVNSAVDATQVPTSPVAATAVPISVVPTAPNYAGRTYEDYLAANPQAAAPQAAAPAPAAPQKN